MGVVTFMHGRWVWLPVCPLQEVVFNGASTVRSMQLVRCPKSRVAARGRLLIHYLYSTFNRCHGYRPLKRGDPLVGGSVTGGSIVTVVLTLSVCVCLPFSSSTKGLYCTFNMAIGFIVTYEILKISDI